MVSTGRAGAQARQGGAIGADQEDRLDQITARLFDRERRQVGIKKRALGHHPVHGQGQLLADLRDRQYGDRGIAPPLLGQPGMCIVDGAFATFHGHIHQVTFVLRGRAGQAGAAGEEHVQTLGKQGVVLGKEGRVWQR